METKNELAVVKSEEERICTKKVESLEEKKALFNALESCDVLLSNCEGQEIAIKDVFCEPRTVIDEKTGETRTKYRTILFDVNGQTYATGSYGIYNMLERMFLIYGMPTWEEGVKVVVRRRPIKDGKTTLTFDLV